MYMESEPNNRINVVRQSSNEEQRNGPILNLAMDVIFQKAVTYRVRWLLAIGWQEDEKGLEYGENKRWEISLMVCFTTQI